MFLSIRGEQTFNKLQVKQQALQANNQNLVQAENVLCNRVTPDVQEFTLNLVDLNSNSTKLAFDGSLSFAENLVDFSNQDLVLKKEHSSLSDFNLSKVAQPMSRAQHSVLSHLLSLVDVANINDELVNDAKYSTPVITPTTLSLAHDFSQQNQLLQTAYVGLDSQDVGLKKQVVEKDSVQILDNDLKPSDGCSFEENISIQKSFAPVLEKAQGIDRAVCYMLNQWVKDDLEILSRRQQATDSVEACV